MAPFTKSDILTYRKDVAAKGRTLSATERERLLQPYLPEPPQKPHTAMDKTPSSTASSSNGGHHQRSRAGSGRKRRVRPFLKAKLHFLVFFLIQLVFGIYIRLRQIY